MATYNTIADYRRGVAEEYKTFFNTAVTAGGVLELQTTAVGVISVEKNGVALATPAAYTFNRPFFLTLVAGLITTDSLVVRCAIHLEDAEIDLLANDVKSAVIDPLLRTVFTLPIGTSAQLKAIDRELVRIRLLQEFGPRMGVGLSDKERDMLLKRWDAAIAQLEAIVNGDVPLVLDAGTEVAYAMSPDDADNDIDIQVDASE